MTSDVFLKQLYNRLKWRVSLKDAGDIIQDYKEYFDEEANQGKTEHQICEALGPPQEIMLSILSERVGFCSKRFLIYLPCLILSLVMPIFYPVMSIWADMQLFFLPYTDKLQYIFILFAPIPALTLYILQHPRTSLIKISNIIVRLLYGVFGLSLLLTSFCSIMMYQFIKQYDNNSITHNVDFALFIFSTLDLSVWIVAISWLLCIIFSEEINRFSIVVYFIFSALTIIMYKYTDILKNIDFSDASNNLMSIVFQPLISQAFTVVFGSMAWIICVFFVNQTRGKQ